MIGTSGESRYGFTAEQWEHAKIEVKRLLIGHARRRETTSYSDLVKVISPVRLQPRSWALMQMLEEVCSEEDVARGTMLASLVRHKGGDGMPGRGYFAHARRLGRDVSDERAFWESECEKVFAAWAAR